MRQKLVRRHVLASADQLAASDLVENGCDFVKPSQAVENVAFKTVDCVLQSPGVGPDLFLNTWLLNLCGQFEQVIERADELCDISTDNEFALWAAGGTLRRGTALLALGRRSEARADLENGIGAWRRTGARLIEPYWKVQYAKAIGDDDPATATNLIDEAMRLVEFSNERWSDTELFLTRGEICESETQDVEAANWYKKAMDSALGQSAIPYLQQSLDRLIPVWIRQEKRDDALKILQEVESRFPHHTNLLDVRTFARMCAE